VTSGSNYCYVIALEERPYMDAAMIALNAMGVLSLKEEGEE
jgi:hypothetical protein